MKINKNLSVLFLLEFSKKSQNEEIVPITARLTINGLRSELSVGAKVHPEFWDQKRQEVVTIKNPGKDDAFSINSILKKTVTDLQTHYLRLEAQYNTVSSELLKASYTGTLHQPSIETEKPPQERTLLQTFNFKYANFAHLAKKGKRAKSTLKKWATTKRKIREFLYFKFKKWDVPLSQIEFHHADDFMNYLVLHHNIEENTARKYLKNTKHLLKLATERKWVPSNAWSTYVVGYDQPKREYLTLSEIITIANKSLIGRLDHARNVFLFACFTGYGFQELLDLTRNDLFIGNDGKRWIMIDRQKTGNPEGMPLLPIPSAIVDKYENDVFCIANNKLLPVRSYHNYSGYLKEIADICGIKLNLTSHVARHTFATTICLDHGVPLETVSKLLGHNNIRSTQIYTKITKRKISDNVADLEKVLFTTEGDLKFGKLPVVTVKRINDEPAAIAI
ncbi:phage integrase family protein [Chitinophaga niastensis]|uniref:Phage integrase family protein n=1 Tax=Chitinophaga niastensis TaxID=536980 RepID=A0A2P8H9F5_CHINA|nr:site-specific integrase [Chitinophaga niastensis]PSL42855.1 phage integrase family protein [Chitinophaga niastensis]